MKNVEKAVVANDKDKAKDALGVAIERIDKATSKGVVTKNFCARNKSRLTKKVNEMK
jgi:small subunit ribosomal protein S20